jgi:autotransporter-associated beta strand protein
VVGGGVDLGHVSGVTISGYLDVSSGGLTSRVVVAHGVEAIGSGGRSISAVVLSGAEEAVAAHGVASMTVVQSGGSEFLAAGGVVDGLTLSSGAQLTDDGTVNVGSLRTFGGALSGGGVLAVTGAGDLIMSGVGSAFKGRVVVSGGTLELAVDKAIGAARVTFAATGAKKTLQIDAADAPAAGDAFANTLSNFSDPLDNVDFRNIAFVSAASAVVSTLLDGPTLIITDGGQTYGLHLQGSIATSYTVTSDGHGGMLITPQATALAQAAAGLSTRGDAGPAPTRGGEGASFPPLFNGAGGRFRATG